MGIGVLRRSSSSFQSLQLPSVACAEMLLGLRVNVDEMTRTVDEPEESIVAVFRRLASVTEFPGESKKVTSSVCGAGECVCWLRDETS